MPQLTPEQLVALKRRSKQPTSFDRKMGLTSAPVRPMPQRRDYVAPVLDSQRNTRANGGNRSYSYLPASELFKGNTWK